MTKAVVDPEELRRFALELKRFNTDVGQRMAALNGRFQNLQQTWRDQEYQKFAEQYGQTMTALGRFVQASETQIPFLLKKAEHIENYLNQR